MKNTINSLRGKEFSRPISIYLLIGLVSLLFLFTGCFLELDLPQFALETPPIAEGMVWVQIPLNNAETREPVSASTDLHQNYVNYYEAVLREQGTAHYYFASAQQGASHLLVPAVPGKTYDVLVLAGVNGTGNGNQDKILLASGYETGFYVQSGVRNVITVKMYLHKTTVYLYQGTAGGNITDPFNGAMEHRPLHQLQSNGITTVEAWKPDGNLAYQTDLMYHAQVEGAAPFLMSASLSAGSTNPTNCSGSAYINQDAGTPVPLSFSLATVGVKDIDPSVAVERLALELYAGIPSAMLAGVAPGSEYRVYFNIGCYAYGDPNSRSSQWHIRNAITYNLNQPLGGAVRLKFVNPQVYYVNSGGDDMANDGLTPGTPFKTLDKAVNSITGNPSSNIRTIVVMGELTGNFTISNIPAGIGEIMLTGYVEGGGGTLKASGGRVLGISGSGTKIRLDHITITGGDTSYGAGVNATSGATLILTDGADVRNNNNVAGGGGIALQNGGTLVMYGGSIQNNKSTDGNDGAGGVWIDGINSTFTMYGGTISGNKAGPGGGVYIRYGTFTMKGGTISGNSATGNGGGVHLNGSTGADTRWFIMEGGVIEGNNHANGVGGGVYCTKGSVNIIRGTIRNNTANNGYNIWAGNNMVRFNGVIQSGTTWNSDVILP
jgi:hypothetical protein